MKGKILSVVVPAYNEVDVVEEFHNRLAKVLDALEIESEVIYVNDGSGDQTLDLLNTIRKHDSRVGIVNLSRNFGKESALTAGLQHASGDGVVVIDADLQDPPELITDFVRVWQEEGAEVVYGQRTARDGESWLKKATANGFYRVMQRVGKVKIPVDSSEFRLMDRRVVDALLLIAENHRFMKGLFNWVGFDQRPVPYRRAPRHGGETKWTFWQRWNLAIEGFTSYSVMPLQVASYLGILCSALAFIYGVFVIIKTLIYGDPVAGYPSLVVIILFLGGIQLLFIGIIGEYLGRVFNETKRRPLYLVKNFEPSNVTSSAALPQSGPQPTIKQEARQTIQPKISKSA